MTFDTFDSIKNEILDDINAISKSKGTEYSNSEDRLANFKRVATDIELDPIKVCWVYFKKHLDAINYVVRGKKELSETFESRIKDAILYLILLYALYVEKDQLWPEHPLVDVEKTQE